MTADRFVIVGSGIAGDACAAELRKRGHEGPITLIGAEPDVPYDRTALSKDVLAGRRTLAAVRLRPDGFYADHAIDVRLGAEVVAIDPDHRRVTLAGGEELPWSRLLLATGGEPHRPAIPGIDLEGVQLLRDARDVEALEAAIAGGAQRALVIGAGFIGAEGAAALRERGLAVTLVELCSEPLERALGVEVGAAIAAVHRAHGVDVRTGRSVLELRGADRVEVAALSNGDELAVDLVLVGLGVAPRVDLAAAAGCAVGDGVIVDERCRTSVDGIFAAGDIAAYPSRFAVRDDGLIRIEHYSNAVEQGAAAAGAMLGADEPYEHLPWLWSDQYDVNLKQVGAPGGWNRVIGRGEPGAEPHAFSVFYLDGDALVAACCVGRARDFRGARALLGGELPVSPDELAQDDLDLYRLSKQRAGTASR